MPGARSAAEPLPLAGVLATVPPLPARRLGLTDLVALPVRASLITTALDEGMSIRDAQWLAGHADPRTTSRHYDLGMTNHDRHPVHIMAARLTA